MDTAPCVSCGTPLPVDRMLFLGNGRYVCQSCDAANDADRLVASGVTKQIIGPPLFALFGTVLICLPFVNIFGPPILGVIAMITGVGSFRLGLNGTPIVGVTQERKVLLLIFGLIGALWGLGLAGLYLLALIGIPLR